LKRKVYFIGMLGLLMLVFTCRLIQPVVKRDAAGKIIVDTKPSSAYLSTMESLRSIHVPRGYRLELVASEPMVQEPVAIAWDGNGRMFVAEMNTYMKDIDATGENQALSKIKRLEDTNGDGKMDKFTVFIDSLVLPRMILPLDDRLLVNETYSNNIYSYRDTNGDGKADEKRLLFRNDVVNKANLEHQKSGLIWNLDNRIYVTIENVRYRYEHNQLVAEQMKESPGGQWGLGNDDYGRLFFSSAGGEIPALSFHQNPYYGRLNLTDQLNEEFQATWPIISTPDVQGGPKRLRPDSTLNHFTGAAGQTVYRGDALPADLKGDLLICEPVGRLIRRAKVINQAGKISLKNAYNREEFIASTDMNFRPVNMATGPDGCLYIVDMYRGIIQEGKWTRIGSYLRPEILKRNLEKNIGRGRIYRLVYDGIKPLKDRPNLLNESSNNLVNYLSHANSWWRENAQKLLVIRADRSIVPRLKEIAHHDHNHLTRIHALWTLKGLHSLDNKCLLQAFKDQDARVRKTAVWIGESYSNDNQILRGLEALMDDPDPEVRFQLALSLRYNQSVTAKSIIKHLLRHYSGQEILAESQQKYEEALAAGVIANQKMQMMAEADRKIIMQGALHFKQLCATCHGPDARGILNGGKDMPAPPLAGSKGVNGDPGKLIRILLHGLTGPVEGKSYSDIMPGMEGMGDEYISAVLSYVRSDFGNKASVILPSDVKKIRQETVGRTKSWSWEELNNLKK
jgi:glucose/arabinose dehydrogenase/mono/diheme cytochrome c family protein